MGVTTRFWISITELLVTMNSFTITERSEYQWIYQWICDIQIMWKLSYLILLWIIVNESLVVFLFLVLIISNFYCLITKDMFEPPGLQKGFYKINSLFLSICLSICLWCIFLRIYSMDFLNFLHEDILPYTKKWQQ